jgi:hypothetical protein
MLFPFCRNFRPARYGQGGGGKPTDDRDHVEPGGKSDQRKLLAERGDTGHRTRALGTVDRGPAKCFFCLF